jgi:aryl-alcohol dehydrogenase-like predicted oxidoreductase
VAEDVVGHAVKSGYRHVDSAHVYRNEEPTAKGMLGAGIPREQLFYTSKVPPKCINYEDAKRCIDESLEKTKLQYIDLYLLHAPYQGRKGRLGAWKALVEAVKEGKVRTIGVSNFGVHHLNELEQWQKVNSFVVARRWTMLTLHRNNLQTTLASSASTRSNSTPGSLVLTLLSGAPNAVSYSRLTLLLSAPHVGTILCSNRLCPNTTKRLRKFYSVGACRKALSSCRKA